jgi:hypothetical protein
MSNGAAHVSILLLGLALLAGIGLVLRGRRFDQRRSVLIRAPAARVWGCVRHLPGLLGGFAKARDFGDVQDFILRAGDGEMPGSLWRAEGSWGSAPYWAEVEIVRCTPERELAFRLLRDSFGTHRRVRHHLGSLTLEAMDAGITKLSWRLRATLRGPRILAARLLWSDHLQARLLDQGLRSIKIALETSERRAPGTPAPGAPRPGVPAPEETARTLPPQGLDQEIPAGEGGRPPVRRPPGQREPTL